MVPENLLHRVLENLRLLEGRREANDLEVMLAMLGVLMGTPSTKERDEPGMIPLLERHEIGHVDVRFLDGSKRRVHFFALRLKYSRFVAVTLVDNERVETILRCLARDCVAFGGPPLMAMFDRPQTIVTKAGVGVEMCAPRSENQKGSGRTPRRTGERIVPQAQ